MTPQPGHQTGFSPAPDDLERGIRMAGTHGRPAVGEKPAQRLGVGRGVQGADEQQPAGVSLDHSSLGGRRAHLGRQERGQVHCARTTTRSAPGMVLRGNVRDTGDSRRAVQNAFSSAQLAVFDAIGHRTHPRGRARQFPEVLGVDIVGADKVRNAPGLGNLFAHMRNPAAVADHSFGTGRRDSEYTPQGADRA